MNPDLQKYYEGQFDLMASEGWKELMVDLQNLHDSYNRVVGLDSENLKFRQGQLDILELVLGRREMCKKAYEELQNEKDF